MIQRIQSLYLLLGALAALGMFFFPFATFEQADLSLVLSGSGLNASDPSLIPDCPGAIVPGILAGLLGLAFLVTLFMFRKRRLQLRILLVTMLINLLLVGGIFLFAGRVHGMSGLGDTPSYGLSAYLSLLTIVFIVLANRGIRKDESMVRAADRLR